MGGATRGETAEPTSRDQNKRQERGQGKGKKIAKVTKKRKLLARKRRRQGRAERRLLRQSKVSNRARARGWEITVATHNVRTMAVDGTHGFGRALDVLSVYDRLGCDVIGLQETRRIGHSVFTQDGYSVYCSGECGGENGGKKGQGGVGIAVRTSMTRAARPPEFSSDRLLKITLELHGRAKAVMFFLWRMPPLKHRMLIINMHSGRAWTRLWRRWAPVNIPAQFCERSAAAKKRFKNLLYKPLILNSPLHLVVPCSKFFNRFFIH